MTGFRLYTRDELRADGYPAEWHQTIKHEVRAQAGHRCIRCGHPYRNGAHGSGEWSVCDERCDHNGPYGVMRDIAGVVTHVNGLAIGDDRELAYETRAWMRSIGDPCAEVVARWRILTVHHLDGDKTNCRWWNLAALCQRCHLQIQGRVVMARVWPWEHSDWFKPYVAGYYASVYLGEELTRDDVEARLEELLALERVA